MRFELKRMQRDLGLTTIYVTHDQSEALALSHEIAVMNEGRIVQIGSPREIYERPRNKFVADFVGTTNFIGGRVASAAAGNGRCLVASAMGELRVQGRAAGQGRAGGRSRCGPRTSSCRSTPLPGDDGDNVCRASSTPRTSSASIWISRSRWAKSCCWRGPTPRCGPRSAIRSICA